MDAVRNILAYSGASGALVIAGGYLYMGATNLAGNGDIFDVLFVAAAAVILGGLVLVRSGAVSVTLASLVGAVLMLVLLFGYVEVNVLNVLGLGEAHDGSVLWALVDHLKENPLALVLKLTETVSLVVFSALYALSE